VIWYYGQIPKRQAAMVVEMEIKILDAQVQVSFQMSCLKRDLWWPSRISISVSMAISSFIFSGSGCTRFYQTRIKKMKSRVQIPDLILRSHWTSSKTNHEDWYIGRIGFQCWVGSEPRDEREPQPEAAVSFRTVVTFVTRLISRTDLSSLELVL